MESGLLIDPVGIVTSFLAGIAAVMAHRRAQQRISALLKRARPARARSR